MGNSPANSAPRPPSKLQNVHKSNGGVGGGLPVLSGSGILYTPSCNESARMEPLGQESCQRAYRCATRSGGSPKKPHAFMWRSHHRLRVRQRDREMPARSPTWQHSLGQCDPSVISKDHVRARSSLWGQPIHGGQTSCSARHPCPTEAALKRDRATCDKPRLCEKRQSAVAARRNFSGSSPA